VALFRRNGCWGAISKTNGAVLRFRDPVYRTLRELAMSYFHEYYNKRHQKTLRSYSRPFDLRRLDPAGWAASENGTWELVDAIDATHHYALLSAAQSRRLTRRDPFERRATDALQYAKPRRKRAGRSRRNP